jgi:hypothetical protein
VDIENIKEPKLVYELADGKSICSELGGAHNIAIKYPYAFIASDKDSSLTVLNIKDPTNPILVFEGTDKNFNSLIDGAHTPFIDGNLLYLTSYKDSSFQIFDISTFE